MQQRGMENPILGPILCIDVFNAKYLVFLNSSYPNIWLIEWGSVPISWENWSSNVYGH